ncbi:class I adenylate-forming enzyme family protein [Pacificoceanicola onchidii]|uniref:class I adenylate-forming enzyme family protein n=1 Tax=Pacificoceanicola onchidii TaxID=2562685 RepID=UPI0010A5D3AA|nr:AMP-binding protein [Pacificoceanicola onchidii]
MNPAQWLLRTATRDPEAPALFTGTQCVATYKVFATTAATLAARLTEAGVRAGDRVALFSGNRTEYLEALYGIWWCGAVAVPINGKLHPKEAAWIISDSGARHVFTDSARATDLTTLLEVDVTCISFGSRDYAQMTTGQALPLPVLRDSDDTAWLFYTSGTTGQPKGVMMTTGNIASMALSYFVDVENVRSDDAILYAAPMSHGAGIYNFMHVMRGARHVVPESQGFDAGEILDLAPRIGPCSMFAAPTMVRRLVDHARQNGLKGDGLRTIVYAGGPMYEADILEAVDVMGPRFIQIYGQGECPMGITALPRETVADRTHPRWRARLNSVGLAQSEVVVDIFDETGKPVPAGTVGEIVVRGRTVMKGYWQNPDATAKTLKDGWLWTGDMGHMDHDGYVTMHDRSKDMIISGGSNIYPREVEEVLLSHPDVREVSVVGAPDPEWGEIVAAFIVLDEAASMREADLDALCIQSIARFKRPKLYRFTDALPKNNYGKVLKTELRQRLSSDEPS